MAEVDRWRGQVHPRLYKLRANQRSDALGRYIIPGICVGRYTPRSPAHYTSYMGRAITPRSPAGNDLRLWPGSKEEVFPGKTKAVFEERTGVVQ